MKELRKLILPSLLLAIAAGAPTLGWAERVTRTIPDTTPLGSGPFKVIPTMDPALAGRTIYAAPDLSVLGARKMPIVAWSNGGCIDNGTRFRWFLSEIASHGYLVLANGRMGSLEEQIWLPPPPSAGTSPPPMPDPSSLPPPATFASQLTEAINWAVAENARKGSRYFGRIDTAKIAVMGMSCGGIHAIQIAVSDPRVLTTVMWNSGLFKDASRHAAGGGPLVSKADLSKLRGSVAYFSGDETDIAYANASDDFAQLRGIPTVWGSRKDTPHDGTFAETNGGDFGRVGVAWLNWRLNGDQTAARMFTGADCGLCRDPNWVVKQKDLR